MSHMADDVEQVAAELVGNAVRAAAGKPWPVSVWLLSDRRRFLITVWDCSGEPPVPGSPDGLSDSGRGLLIVAALSSIGWGSQPAGFGKVVWSLMYAS
jgi:anti-sigma regulatory factor (Ser/Thr protein kinase)